MLILSRRKNEAIFIGDDIRVSVVEVSANQTRLGFEAKRDIPIFREEIYRRRRSKQQHND